MMNNFKSNLSREVLSRVFIAGFIAAVIVVLNLAAIKDVYFKGQITSTGLIINGSIFALFALGMIKLIMLLLRYMREEAALTKFVRALEKDLVNPADRLGKNTFIRQRFQAIEQLGKQRSPINHSAFASMLAANESARISFPKFINNILILTGVFGTIVSLSIALVGASNLLGSSQDMGSMGMVIHGMSTALSTTITAILCYVFYGYFYLKLTDVQTHVLSGIEQVTAMHLLPKYTYSNESMIHEVASLIHGLRRATESMQATQADYAEASNRLTEVISSIELPGGNYISDVREIKQLLRDGFRLPIEGKK
jgi:hypothetical protein